MELLKLRNTRIFKHMNINDILENEGDILSLEQFCASLIFDSLIFKFRKKFTSTAMEGPAVSVVVLPYFSKILLTLRRFPGIH